MYSCIQDKRYISPSVTLKKGGPLYANYYHDHKHSDHDLGKSGVAVTLLHGNDQDVGSNPATARNEKNAQWADP